MNPRDRLDEAFRAVFEPRVIGQAERARHLETVLQPRSSRQSDLLKTAGRGVDALSVVPSNGRASRHLLDGEAER